MFLSCQFATTVGLVVVVVVVVVTKAQKPPVVARRRRAAFARKQLAMEQRDAHAPNQPASQQVSVQSTTCALQALHSALISARRGSLLVAVSLCRFGRRKLVSLSASLLSLPFACLLSCGQLALARAHKLPLFCRPAFCKRVAQPARPASAGAQQPQQAQQAAG